MAGKAGAIRQGRAFVELFADDTKLVRGLRKAEAHVKKFGDTLSSYGRGGMAFAGAVGAGVGLASRTFMNLQDVLLATQAVTNATEDQLKSLADQAKYLGATTSWTAKDVADLMLNLGRAGFSISEIQSAVPAVMNLARATGTDLGNAANIAANAVRAFGLQASDTSMVADVLTATANGSAQTLADLGQSIAYVAPIAAEADESIQSMGSALGVLANMGIKGSMAGTMLRQILLRLTDPSVQKKLKAIGVNAVQADGSLAPLGDTMIALGKAMSSMPNAERLAIAKDLFDQRSVSGVLKLSGTPEMFDRLSESINNSGGTAERTAQKMDSKLGGAWRIMRSAIEDIQIAIGEALEPVLTRWMNRIEKIAFAISRFVRENQNLIQSAIKAVAVIGVFSVGLFVAGQSMRLIGAAIGLLRNSVMMVLPILKLLGVALTTPWIIIPALAVAALAIFTDTFSGVGEAFRSTMDGVKQALADGDITRAAKILWTGLKLIWAEGTQGLSNFWDGLVLAASHDFLTIKDFCADLWIDMKKIWADGINGLLGLWDGLVKKLSQAAIIITNPFNKKERQELFAALEQNFDEKKSGRAQKLSEYKNGLEASRSDSSDLRTALDNDFAEKVDERTAGIAKLREELKQLKTVAKEEAQSAAIETVSEITSNSGGTAKSAENKQREVQGSFYANQSRSLAAGGESLEYQKQTAANTDEMVTLLQEISRNGGGLTYGG